MMKRGQGLLETIVAIGVVMTGLVSVMALVISNLNTQRDAAMRYQAINFAREALELVRNRRDTNWLIQSAGTWDGLPGSERTSIGTDFIMPLPPENFENPTLALASDANVHICQAENGLFVQHATGCGEGENETIFSRRILLEQFDCGPEWPVLAALDCNSFSQQENVAIRVNAFVTWQQGDRERNVRITETLYDWR